MADNARITQLVTELLEENTPASARLTQVVTELLMENLAPLTISVSDDMNNWSDSPGFTERVHLQVSGSEDFNNWNDGIPRGPSAFDHLLITGSEDLNNWIDTAALSLATRLGITGSENMNNWSDLASLALWGQLGISGSDSMNFWQDEASNLVLGRIWGTNILILARMFLPDGDKFASSIGVRYATRYYEPRVTHFDRIERSIPIPTGLPRLSDGGLRIADTDQEYRKTFAENTPISSVIEQRMVPTDGALLSSQLIYRGKVSQVTFPEGAVDIKLSDRMFEFFEEEVPVLGTVDVFPNMPEGKQETFIPIPIGTLDSSFTTGYGSMRVDLIDTTLNRYPISRYASEELLGVWGKGPEDEEFTELTAGTDYTEISVGYTIDEVDYSIDFIDLATSGLPASWYSDETPTSIRSNVEIRIDIKGALWEGTAATNNPIRAIQKWLTHVVQYDDDGLNSVAFNVAAATADSLGYTCGGAFTEIMTHRTALSQLVSSFVVDLFQDKNGLIAVVLTSDSDPNRPVFDDLFQILVESVTQSLPDPPYNSIVYRYAWIPADKEFMYEERYDNAADQGIMGEVIQTEIDMPFVQDAATANLVVTEYASYHHSASYRIQFDLSGPKAIDQLELAKLIGVTHYGGIDESGAGFTNEEFKIDRLIFDPNQLKYTVHAVRRVPGAGPTAGVLNGAWGKNCRPQITFYAPAVFFCGFASLDQLAFTVHRSIDWGASWSKSDESSQPTFAATITSWDIEREGHIFHVITQETTGRVAYHQFSLRTNRWAVVDEEVLASASLHTTWTTGCAIGIRNNGEVWIMYHGDEEVRADENGSPFSTLFARKRLGLNSWASAARLDEAWYPTVFGQKYGSDYQAGRIVAGQGNRLHFFARLVNWGAAYQNVTCRTLRENNTWSDEHNIEPGILNGLFYPAWHAWGNPARYVEDDGTVRMIMPLKGGWGRGEIMRVTSADDITDNDSGQYFYMFAWTDHGNQPGGNGSFQRSAIDFTLIDKGDGTEDLHCFAMIDGPGSGYYVAHKYATAFNGDIKNGDWNATTVGTYETPDGTHNGVDVYRAGALGTFHKLSATAFKHGTKVFAALLYEIGGTALTSAQQEAIGAQTPYPTFFELVPIEDIPRESTWTLEAMISDIAGS